MIAQKQCAHCRKVKPVTEFWRNYGEQERISRVVLLGYVGVHVGTQRWLSADDFVMEQPRAVAV